MVAPSREVPYRRPGRWPRILTGSPGNFFSAVPATLDALSIAKEVFDEKGVNYQPQEVFDASETPDDLFNRGSARRIEYMGPPAGGGQGPVTQAEREFNRLTVEYYWGSVWTRPGLDLPSRSICTLAALTALGREAQLAGHIRGALNVGLTAGPLGIDGTAWDVAWATVFLASDEARWISGVTLPVDAGLLAATPLAMFPYLIDSE